jgi:NAD(P)-dependent dehydrogenase (short-subunit alcohol dehydrogenase family)
MSDFIDLTGRVVLLTGSTGDIGAAYLAALTGAGASVVATDLPGVADEGRALASKATSAGPGQAVFAVADVTSDADLDAAAARAVETFGGLDVLVNNAAIYKALGSKRPLTELRAEDWDVVLRVNVRGSWQAIKAVVPAMRERGGGRIINISSVVARSGAAGFAHYVASKAAIDGLTRAAARELGPSGITVNGVAPGLVSDEATHILNDAGYVARAAQGRSIGREMTPSDLVGTVLFLASQASGFMTGQTLIVDGGQVFA